MTLSAGTTLGAYDIVALLGAGGMGQVYRARDTKLGRDVAIKVLSDLFVADPDRIARFRREAQLLAALNHPPIAAIYSFDQADSTHFLVLELVGGETLAERLRRGPLALGEALAIGRQIIDALEAAHDKDIIHRDLKPANIALTAGDQVNVLDFGLAKTLGKEPAEASNSPTLTLGATQAGLVLGTAAYMSPEQAKGRAADKRSDVWAFGCVLFEMLAGRRPFAGDDVSDTLAAVLKSEPDWEALPAEVPAFVHTLIRRCLVKDRVKRIPDLAVVRFLLDEGSAADGGAGVPPTRAEAPAGPRRFLPWVVAGASAAIVAAAMLLLWAPWRTGASQPVVRFAITLPDSQQFRRPTDGNIAVAPDGTRMVYAADRQLYQRSFGDMESRAIAGTLLDVVYPVFSPDSQWIAFFSFQDGTLKKVAATGGAALTLCNITIPFGLSWHGDDLLFGQSGKGIMRVSAEGGQPELLTAVRAGEVASDPQLDGGRALVFAVASEPGAERWQKARIVGQRLGSTERRVIVEGGSDPRYMPSGHLVYALGGSLLALRFDPASLDARGGPVPVLEGATRSAAPISRGGLAQWSVSATGVLVFVPGAVGGTAAPRRLALASRDGRLELLNVPQQPYLYPRVSPDGTRLAVQPMTARTR